MGMIHIQEYTSMCVPVAPSKRFMLLALLPPSIPKAIYNNAAEMHLRDD